MKVRIDVLLVERGLAESRTKAQWLIRNGYVSANNKKVWKPSKKVENFIEIHLLKEFPYVGRGGIKLEKALEDFLIDVNKKVCVDIGASVGGFTDCLIKKGALKVYSVDTATNLLHPSLMNETFQDKIIAIFGVDARNLIPIDELVDICTIDVTFASLREILPNIKNILRKKGDIIALVKPIFEIDFYNKKKFKNINNAKQLFKILNELVQWLINNDFFLHGIIKSPQLEKEGSKEFFLHLKLKKSSLDLNYKKLIRDMLT
ncbi:MAG: TlyA family RNA methyltransferase [Promethearchaeota archaeon]